MRLLFKWTIYLPKKYDNEQPTYYWDQRYLFRYYTLRTYIGGAATGKIEPDRGPIDKMKQGEIFSLRFLSNSEIGMYLNGNVVAPTIKLPLAPIGGQPYDVALDIEFKNGGEIKAVFDGAGHAPLRFDSAFFKGDAMWLAAPGNGLLNDRDLDYFSSLGKVAVYAPAPSAP